MNIFDHFTNGINPHWNRLLTGTGEIQCTPSVLRLGHTVTHHDYYTDAQIDDFVTLRRSDFIWRPPLRLTVRARTSAPAAETQHRTKGTLKGTAGFGFWNKPFSMKGDIFTLPESIWFFYASPPSNMTLVPGSPGWGWKAQVIHAMRFGALPHVVPLSLAVLYGRITGRYNSAIHWIQRFSGAYEAVIHENMTLWHTYTLEWRKHRSRFWVDGKLVLQANIGPTQPLGFVAWIDNEYAVAKADGEIRFGHIASGPQWLELDSVNIEQLHDE